jgi:hypothetical protein
MLNKTAPSFLLLAALFGASQPASADIVATLSEYNGPFYDFCATYPIPLANIGDFAFAIPHGATIVSATISGTFGNNDFSPHTALSDYYVDGTAIIEVVGCDDPSANCAQGNTATAWSYRNFRQQPQSVQLHHLLWRATER